MKVVYSLLSGSVRCTRLDAKSAALRCGGCLADSFLGCFLHFPEASVAAAVDECRAVGKRFREDQRQITVPVGLVKLEDVQKC